MCYGLTVDFMEKEIELDEDGYDEYGNCYRCDYPMIISDSSAHWGPIANFKTGECKYEIYLYINKLLNKE